MPTPRAWRSGWRKARAWSSIPSTVQTNIVIFRVTPDAPDAATVVARAREQGVLLFAFGPRTLRLVTHADVTTDQCVRAAEILTAICES